MAPSDSYSTLDVIWISLFSAMLTVAILGNVLVIWIVLAHRRMRTVTNYFLLNLSVADLTMAILNGAPNFFYMLRNYWVFGEILCVVNNFVANFTVASCVFTMMAISIDRWIAVMRPLEPRMSKKVAWRAIFAIWICSAVLASPALIFSHTKTYPNGATHCMLIWPDRKTPDESIYDLTYNVILLVITYVIPMTAMAICYGTMSWELWGHTHIGEVTERQRSSMISKRKVVRMFIMVVLSFAICWLPYHGYFIYIYFDKTIVFKPWIQPLFLSFYFLAMSTAMINPIVYYLMNGRFRTYIQGTMKTCCCSCFPCCNIGGGLNGDMGNGHHHHHLHQNNIMSGRRRTGGGGCEEYGESPAALLRHCNNSKFNQNHNQSPTCSRSDDNTNNRDLHHGNHNHHYPPHPHQHQHQRHHHHHHPRMNPHQIGLDDRLSKPKPQQLDHHIQQQTLRIHQNPLQFDCGDDTQSLDFNLAPGCKNGNSNGNGNGKGHLNNNSFEGSGSGSGGSMSGSGSGGSSSGSSNREEFQQVQLLQRKVNLYAYQNNHSGHHNHHHHQVAEGGGGGVVRTTYC